MPAALLCAAIVAVPAHANVYLFTPDILDLGVAAPGEDLGTTHTFTVSGINVVAAPYAITGNPTPDLYAKNAGAGESGLGLTLDQDGDNEITTTDFLQLDFADPEEKHISQV